MAAPGFSCPLQDWMNNNHLKPQTTAFALRAINNEKTSSLMTQLQSRIFSLAGFIHQILINLNGCNKRQRSTYLMGFNALVALVGLTFSMISIKLMSALENAQVIAGRINSRRHSRMRNDKIVALAMSTPKLLAIRIGVAFFGKISSIIFVAEAMYPERVVEGATMAIMKTVVISNRIRIVTTKHGKHAMTHIKTRYHHRGKLKHGNSEQIE
ncbi:MAG TPA: hypothetical protein VD736_09355 [Nitrososphaera sp.]|nr:hypothetical protein [Nitrososphaera sp.]